MFQSVPARRRARFASRAALVAGAMLLPAHAWSADATGNFAVRGVGSAPCAQFVAAIDGNSPDTRIFVAWMEGAVSAANRLTSGVFDHVPFSAPGAMAALVLRQCREQPNAGYDAAVRAVMDRLRPFRVSTNSPWVEMTVGTNRVSLRAETLAAVQARLLALGLQTAPPDGRFSVATREALKRFQMMRRLPQTELPDPDTLVALLVQQ